MATNLAPCCHKHSLQPIRQSEGPGRKSTHSHSLSARSTHWRDVSLLQLTALKTQDSPRWKTETRSLAHPAQKNGYTKGITVRLEALRALKDNAGEMLKETYTIKGFLKVPAARSCKVLCSKGPMGREKQQARGGSKALPASHLTGNE